MMEIENENIQGIKKIALSWNCIYLLTASIPHTKKHLHLTQRRQGNKTRDYHSGINGDGDVSVGLYL